MAIIAISRESFVRGSEVGKKVAERLGYECISREILIEASEVFNIPEIKLVRAIHDAPSILDRIRYGKVRYIAYIRTALLRRVQKDNVIYHGVAGHIFLQDIPHVLKVRIFDDMERRVREESIRMKISEEEARDALKKDDEERRKWGLSLYGKDTWDAGLYDLVMRLNTLTPEDAADIIAQTAVKASFQATPESQQLLDDRVLASQVESILIEEYPRIVVKAGKGDVEIHIATGITPVSASKKEEIIRKVEEIAVGLGGARSARVEVSHSLPGI
ncbi:MAG: cytidylate kinase-like family protein [Thermodesulfobacteriota bacterium]